MTLLSGIFSPQWREIIVRTALPLPGELFE